MMGTRKFREHPGFHKLSEVMTAQPVVLGSLSSGACTFGFERGTIYLRPVPPGFSPFRTVRRQKYPRGVLWTDEVDSLFARRVSFTPAPRRERR